MQPLQVFLKGLRGLHALTLGQRCAACEQPSASTAVCMSCTGLCLTHSSKSNRCPRCATIVGFAVHHDFGQLCGACISKPPSFDAAVCVGSFTQPLSGLIAQYKFGSKLMLAPWFAAKLNPRLQGLNFDLITAVPLFDARLKSRGFNQSWEIAKRLETYTRLATQFQKRTPARHVLTRLRDTPSQRDVTASQRFANVKGAFAADESVRGLRVLLVDDVVTTTATAQAASLALKSAGAAHITIACIARVSD